MSDTVNDAREMADYLGLPDQAAGESEQDFRIRVAGVLRGQGRLIEAQEILVGRRWDDPDNPPNGELGNPLTGVAGALAAAFEGVDWGGDDERRVQDDAVAGVIALAGPDPTKEAIARAFDLLGPEAAMDFLGGGRS